MEIYSAITEVFQPRESFEINKILDNLWVSNVYTAKNHHILRHNNIKHVLSLYPVNLKPEFNQLYVNVYDFAGADIQKHFDQTFDFIDEHRNNGDAVLVHCHVGRSRAATIVIHYLMKKYKISFEKAYNYLKTKRSIIHPNPGFRLQLKKAEERILKEDLITENTIPSLPEDLKMNNQK
jgi:protein-tyrosine phosphatase